MDQYVKIQIISFLNETQLAEYLNEVIKNWLKETIDFSFDEETSLEQTLSNFYEITYSKKTVGTIIYGIKLSPFEYIPPEYSVNEYVNSLLDQLLDEDKILYLFKFFDSSTLPIYQKLFEEIFNIEANLREILSFIFYTTYPNKIYNTLANHRIGLQENFENKQGDVLRKNFENEFHYVLFTDYKKLKETKKIQHDDLFNIISNVDSFDALKKELNKNGIKNQLFIDFFDKIKEKIDPIEKMRNCVMHSRKIANSLLDNYEKAKSEIIPIIEEFWSKLDSVCLKCGHEMFIQNGRNGQFWSCTQWPECKGSKSIEMW